MTYATDRVVRKCARCGAPIEVGERVDLGLGWEVSAPETDCGYLVGAPKVKHRSAKVCRSCGIEAAREAGLAVPGEALAFPPLQPPARPVPAIDGARVFLSGPMTGIEDWNRAAFADAARRCLEMGALEVFDPAADAPRGPDPHSHEHWMRRTLSELTRWTNGTRSEDNEPYWRTLVLLEGWGRSEGARIERAVALACGIAVAEEGVLHG